MKSIIFVFAFVITQLSFAQSIKRPDTPYWRLVAEVERTGLVAYERFNWSEKSLEKLKSIPTLNGLISSIGRSNVIYKMGGENPGKNGFTTRLKNGDIYVQVYYAKHLKNIDVVLTLGHELIHAMHIDLGLHESWKRDARTNHKEYAECMSESGAYSWSGIYSSDKRTYEWNKQLMEEAQACVKRNAK